MKNYLIDFVDDASDDAVSAYLTANQCVIVHAFKNLNKVYHVQSDNVPPADSIVTSIIDDDESTIKLLEVKSVPVISPSKTETIEVHPEKNWWKIYSMKDVDLSLDTTDLDIYGNNVNVYVVDSGIDLSHPEFSGQNINLLQSLTGEFNDTSGHGTALASLIVGNTCGATSSSLSVIKIFDKNQETKQSDLLHAFDAIIADIENNIVKIPVINLSWSIPKNIYVEDKIRHLIKAGALVVVAAGNSGTPIPDVTPASMPDVITVGSYGINFTPSDFSDYSNPSAVSLTNGTVNTGALDTWAPGEQIWVATPNGGYASASGTSMSAAIYTASVAYNLSRHITPTNDLPLLYTDDNNQIKLVATMGIAERTGLLDLSDPKYSSSINQICTFHNSKIIRERSNPKSSTEPIVFHAKTNEKKVTALFARGYVDSYEWLTPLPDWAIDDMDYLILYPKSDPTNPLNYEMADVQLKLNLKDGSDPVIIEYKLIALGSEFDQSLLPPDDPMVKVTLLNRPCNATIAPGCQATFGCQASTGIGCSVTGSGKSCRCYS